MPQSGPSPPATEIDHLSDLEPSGGRPQSGALPAPCTKAELSPMRALATAAFVGIATAAWCRALRRQRRRRAGSSAWSSGLLSVSLATLLHPSSRQLAS